MAPGTRRERWLQRIAILAGGLALGTAIATTTSDRIRPAPPPAAYSVEAIPRSPRTQGTVQVDVLLRDGIVAAYPDDAVHTGWIETAKDGPGFSPHLVGHPNAAAHQVTFHASRFATVMQADDWQGTIILRRAGDVVHEVSVDHDRRIVLDEAGPRSPIALLFLAVLLGGVVTAVARPGRGERNRVTWLLLVIGGTHLAYWAGQPIGIDPDSTGYLDGLSTLSMGYPSYFPPGYSALLGLAGGRSSASLGLTVTLIQHVMVVIIGYWIYRMLRERFGIGSALLAALAASLAPPVLQMAQVMMTETLAGFAMVGAWYFGVASEHRSAVVPALLAGALTGIATVTRVVPIVALGLALAVWYLLPAHRRRWGAAALTAAAAGVVIAIPAGWFWMRSGSPALANSAGLHVYNRVVVQQRLIDSTGPATRDLIARVNGSDVREQAFWDLQDHPGLQDLGYDGRVDLLGSVAVEGILSNPVRYLAYTPWLATLELLVPGTVTLARWQEMRSPSYRVLESPPLLAPNAASLRVRLALDTGFFWGWLLLILLAIAGVVIGLRSVARRFILGVFLIPAGYLLSSAMLDLLMSRHNIPITPFLVVLAVIPFAALARRTASTPTPDARGIS
jgi:hypothetical protein